MDGILLFHPVSTLGKRGCMLCVRVAHTQHTVPYEGSTGECSEKALMSHILLAHEGCI